MAPPMSSPIAVAIEMDRVAALLNSVSWPAGAMIWRTSEDEGDESPSIKPIIRYQTRSHAVFRCPVAERTAGM